MPRSLFVSVVLGSSPLFVLNKGFECASWEMHNFVVRFHKMVFVTCVIPIGPPPLGRGG